MPSSGDNCANYISASSVNLMRLMRLSALSAAMLTLSACGRDEPVSSPPRAALTAPVLKTGAGGSQITGVVRSLGAYDVAIENPGRLVRLRANVGDRVAAGQILAEFDAEPLRLQASQSEAQSRAAGVELEAARREALRLEGLVAAGAASRQDLDTARTSVKRAEAQQRAAADQAALSARALSKASVRAPAAGVITGRQGELGAILPAGAVVFSLEAGGEREIVAPLSGAVAVQMRPGAVVTFSSGGVDGRARLSGLSPRAAGIDAQTARFTIISGAPAPGASVAIALSGSTANDDFLLPLSAVLADRSGARRVLVVDQGGKTSSEPVQLLEVSSAGARVRGHLAPGQRVIAAGGELIKAGERVRPLPFTP